MGVDEFIEQYAKIELLKMSKAGQLEEPTALSADNVSRGGRSAGRSWGKASAGVMEGPALSMAEMKQIMKESLRDVATYEERGFDGAIVTKKSGTLLEI